MKQTRLQSLLQRIDVWPQLLKLYLKVLRIAAHDLKSLFKLLVTVEEPLDVAPSGQLHFLLLRVRELTRPVDGFDLQGQQRVQPPTCPGGSAVLLEDQLIELIFGPYRLRERDS